METIFFLIIIIIYTLLSFKNLSRLHVHTWTLGSFIYEIPNLNSPISCNNGKKINKKSLMSFNQTKGFSSQKSNQVQSLTSFAVRHRPRSHLPTLPSRWSVLGSAMMAWTATMASLILVCSSLSSSMCSRRRIWAASFRVASEEKRQKFYQKLTNTLREAILMNCGQTDRHSICSSAFSLSAEKNSLNK